MDALPDRVAVVAVHYRIESKKRGLGVVQYPNSKILLFAKAPLPGRVKTRLIPILGAEAAAQLYQQLLIATVERVASASVAPITCFYTPNEEHPIFERLASQWKIELRQQRGVDLGERMAQAVAITLESSDSAILIGGDCPQLNANHLQQTLTWLYRGLDAVIGPAEDGGYVLLGLRRYNRRLFEDITWGGSDVLELTRERLRELSWSWRELETLWDLDRPEDLKRYQAGLSTPSPSRKGLG